MVISFERYFQFLVFFTTCVFVFSQRGINQFDNPLPIAPNPYQRPGATGKSSIVNDISNSGGFTFNARYNQNQIVIDGTLLHYFNDTKELMITGLARVILISKGFNTNSNGHFDTFDSKAFKFLKKVLDIVRVVFSDFDQFENRVECPPSTSTDTGYEVTKGVKAFQTIVG